MDFITCDGLYMSIGGHDCPWFNLQCNLLFKHRRSHPGNLTLTTITREPLAHGLKQHNLHKKSLCENLVTFGQAQASQLVKEVFYLHSMVTFYILTQCSSWHVNNVILRFSLCICGSGCWAVKHAGKFCSNCELLPKISFPW